MEEGTFRIKDMVFHAYHGVLSEERRLGQKYEVDVEYSFDIARTVRTDSLDATVNYSDVFNTVEEIVRGRTFNLVETLAESIANNLISSFPMKSVTVRVRKPHPPVEGHISSVEVEIHKGKA